MIFCIRQAQNSRASQYKGGWLEQTSKGENTSATYGKIDGGRGSLYQKVGKGRASCQGFNDSTSLHGQQGVGNVAGPQLDDTGGDVGLPAGSLLLVLLDHCGQALQHQVQAVLP